MKYYPCWRCGMMQLESELIYYPSQDIFYCATNSGCIDATDFDNYWANSSRRALHQALREDVRIHG